MLGGCATQHNSLDILVPISRYLSFSSPRKADIGSYNLGRGIRPPISQRTAGDFNPNLLNYKSR